MLGSATPEQYAGCLKVLLDDPGVNAILIIIPPPPVGTAKAIVQAMLPILRKAQKPAVVALIGDHSIRPAVKPLQKAHIPVYHHPEKAASALAALVKHAHIRERISQKTTCFADMNHDKVKEILSAFSIDDDQSNTLVTSKCS